MSSTRILLPTEYDAWNRFVAAHPRGDLLQSTAWGALKARGGWQASVLVLEDGGGIRAGMLLLRRALPLGRSLVYAPRGPVWPDEDLDALAALLRGARDHARRLGGIMLKVDPPVEDVAPAATLERLGFRAVGGDAGLAGTQPRCVMQLDLQRPIDDVLASFHAKWRYNIRLAAKRGVSVRQSDDRGDLDAFYPLLLETAKRDGFLVRGKGYFEAMWDELVPRGWMRLFLGEVEGRPVCGALTFLFGDKAWYTYGASANIHREKMPNHAMQWEMIRWAHDKGCRWYDFRGVSCSPDDPDDPTAGLNRFKRGFNPRFVRYIGEYDLPLHAAAYWAFTKALPGVRSVMRRSRGREAAAEAEG